MHNQQECPWRTERLGGQHLTGHRCGKPVVNLLDGMERRCSSRKPLGDVKMRGSFDPGVFH